MSGRSGSTRTSIDGHGRSDRRPQREVRGRVATAPAADLRLHLLLAAAAARRHAWRNVGRGAEDGEGARALPLITDGGWRILSVPDTTHRRHRGDPETSAARTGRIVASGPSRAAACHRHLRCRATGRLDESVHWERAGRPRTHGRGVADPRVHHAWRQWAVDGRQRRLQRALAGLGRRGTGCSGEQPFRRAVRCSPREGQAGDRPGPWDRCGLRSVAAAGSDRSNQRWPSSRLADTRRTKN